MKKQHQKREKILSCNKEIHSWLFTPLCDTRIIKKHQEMKEERSHNIQVMWRNDHWGCKPGQYVKASYILSVTPQCVLAPWTRLHWYPCWQNVGPTCLVQGRSSPWPLWMENLQEEAQKTRTTKTTNPEITAENFLSLAYQEWCNKCHKRTVKLDPEIICEHLRYFWTLKSKIFHIKSR